MYICAVEFQSAECDDQQQQQQLVSFQSNYIDLSMQRPQLRAFGTAGEMFRSRTTATSTDTAINRNNYGKEDRGLVGAACFTATATPATTIMTNIKNFVGFVFTVVLSYASCVCLLYFALAMFYTMHYPACCLCIFHACLRCKLKSKKRMIVKLRFHNRFIYVGVDISIYALLTGGRILYLPVYSYVLCSRLYYALSCLLSLHFPCMPEMQIEK